MNAHDEFLGEIWRSTEVARDFADLTACGGRLVGSDSERCAHDLLAARLGEIDGASVRPHEFAYERWRNLDCTLERVSPGPLQHFAAHALVWSAETPAVGLVAEVVDLGRGTPDEFDGAGESLRGRIALVRHEYPFSDETIHRRVKYDRAREGGAAAFAIAGEDPAVGLVAGSCGRDAADNIPAIGVSGATAAVLAAVLGTERPRFRLRIRNARAPTVGRNLIAEVSGRDSEWIVLCAHYDGHDLAESALDNATGVVSVLQILRGIARRAGQLRRGLRAILFTAEETALTGSRIYADGLTDEECRRIAAVVNLDTLAGSARYTCLTNGFEDVSQFISTVAKEAGLDVRISLPVMRNSDHFNFVRRGIPALRLIAGFDDPAAGAQRVLTAADTADKVPIPELKLGTLVAGEIVWRALVWPGRIARHKLPHEIGALLSQTR